MPLESSTKSALATDRSWQDLYGYIKTDKPLNLFCAWLPANYCLNNANDFACFRVTNDYVRSKGRSRVRLVNLNNKTIINEFLSPFFNQIGMPRATMRRVADNIVNVVNEVLTKFHRPSQLTNKPDFTAAELQDVISFLKSL